MQAPIATADKPLRILVIGDSHERPGSSAVARSRWVALGRFACRQKPDAIVHLGDHWDLDSLNRKSKLRGGPGRSAIAPDYTFETDVEAGKDSIKAFTGEIKRYNARASRSGRKDLVYNPWLEFCLGNHEMRIHEAAGESKEMRDYWVVDRHIGRFLKDHGFTVAPFLKPICLGGVFFVHYVESGPMGNAVAIAHAPRLIGRSTVWGHTHRLGYAERQIPEILGGGWDKWLCVPTFKDPGKLNPGEISGVVLLDDVYGGNFTHSIISTDRLLRDYGPLYRAAA